MTKLCPRGKAAAKRKFKVYPSAYANAYASKICAGKIKDPSGTKRKDWGPKKANKGTIVTVAKKLEKASKAHAAQAKALRGIKKANKGYFNDQPIEKPQKQDFFLDKMPTRDPYNGPLIKENLDGQEVSNKSSVAYYKGMIDV